MWGGAVEEEARAPVFRSIRSFHSAKQPPRGEVTAPPPEPDEGGRSNPLWKSPSREHGGEQMLSFYSVAPVKTRAY